MAKTPAKTETTAVAVSGEGFEEFAGVGMENVASSDLLVPRLGILQALSPQINKRKPEYIEGAEPGLIADLGLGQLFPEGVWFLPVHYRKEYLEWSPKDSGGGLVDVHQDPAILDRTTRNDFNQNVLANGNHIVETAQFFGLNLSANRRMCFVPMTMTQLKVARRWNTLAMEEKLQRADGSEFTAPFFYRTYRLSVSETSNAKGEWFIWNVKRDLALPEVTVEEHGMDWRTLKEEAVAFNKRLLEGEARADLNSADEEVVSEGEGAM